MQLIIAFAGSLNTVAVMNVQDCYSCRRIPNGIFVRLVSMPPSLFNYFSDQRIEQNKLVSSVSRSCGMMTSVMASVLRVTSAVGKPFQSYSKKHRAALHHNATMKVLRMDSDLLSVNGNCQSKYRNLR